MESNTVHAMDEDYHWFEANPDRGVRLRHRLADEPGDENDAILVVHLAPAHPGIRLRARVGYYPDSMIAQFLAGRTHTDADLWPLVNVVVNDPKAREMIRSVTDALEPTTRQQRRALTRRTFKASKVRQTLH